MNPRRLNHKVIYLLKHLSDDNIISVRQTKHIKVSGMFGGKKEVITLSSSPSHSRYESIVRSRLRRLLESIGIDKELIEKTLHL